MLLRRLLDREEIVALDDTRVRELLNPEHDGGDLVLDYSLAHAKLGGHQKSAPHRFKTASEVYYFLRGRGIIHIDEESAEVGPGDTVYIPPMAVQYVENVLSEDLDFLCIVNPPWTPDAEEKV
jgi:mannose-6-phosphate isomerase-like protein (cupin superfamily)